MNSVTPICLQPQNPRIPHTLIPIKCSKASLPGTDVAQSTVVDLDLTISFSPTQIPHKRTHLMLPQRTSNHRSGNSIHSPRLFPVRPADSSKRSLGRRSHSMPSTIASRFRVKTPVTSKTNSCSSLNPVSFNSIGVEVLDIREA